jgi:hypothetical protein
MARTRRLDELRADAYKRSDNEGATARHPPADVTRYVNQGRAEVYDLLVEARGRQFFRKIPAQAITTVANTTRYSLNADFYRLISVRKSCESGQLLVPFRAEDEPSLREPGVEEPWPTHYELQGPYIELLPKCPAGQCIVVDYVPHIADLAADGDTHDGINGWEEYVVAFAARCMAVKDEEYQLARELRDEMDRLAQRISKLAPTRDAFRAERVKDVRGYGPFARWR